VAAYAGRDGEGFDYPDSVPAGRLRAFSSRGLRIDGEAILDIAGPDNPITATNSLDGEGRAIPFGAYEVFSGTSGATPHVGGVAALVKQAYPELDGLEVRDRIRAGARVDEHVTGDATHPVDQLWGAGKVSAYRAVFGEAPPANTAPTIAVEAIEVEVGETASLLVAVSDAESAVADLRLRVDVDYDGTWDEQDLPASEAPQAEFLDLGTFYVKVEVVDPLGMTAAALVRVTVVERDGCDCQAGGGDRPSPDGWVVGLVVLAAAWPRRRPRGRAR
jgi:MYXO-CTERM domain-containing protein